MECLLAVCLYAEVALGYQQNDDVRRYIADNPQMNPAATEALSQDGVAGFAAFGADRRWGRLTGFAEVYHRSNTETSRDEGTQGARAGIRIRF